MELKNVKPVVIFGMLNNKRIEIFLSKIKNQTKKLLAIKIPEEKNAFSTQEIKNKSDLLSIKCLKLKDLKEAINYIKKSDQKIFLITGSLYLVGKIRGKFL